MYSENEATAYPLTWPIFRPRTKVYARQDSSFRHGGQKLTLARAVRRMTHELDLLGARRLVVSTNVELRLDGLPMSGRREPEDTGVAIYFSLKGVPHCMPCDKWIRVEDNIAAVAKHVEAIRGMTRWGVGDVMAAFAGYKALPPATALEASWWDVLKIESTATLEEVEAAWKAMAAQHHPDSGGTHDRMAEINSARDRARRDLADG